MDETARTTAAANGPDQEKAPPRGAALSTGVAIGVAILVAGGAGLLLGRHQTAPAASGVAAPIASSDEKRRPDASLERQIATRRLADWKVEPFDRLAPVDDGAAAVFEPMLHPAPPFDAVDATLFDAFDMRIRLAHAKPVGRDEACLDHQGLRFACGLRGRASLQNFLFGKTVTCTRLFLGHGENPDVVDARCSAGGVDLATRQIRAGWAFPSVHGDADHRAALEEAQRERAGVWAGPYDVPRVDHSIEDARDLPFGSLRNPN
jgi:endonuclease YncB( thermonuclease family)